MEGLAPSKTACALTVTPFVKHCAEAATAVPSREAISLQMRGGLVNKSSCQIFLYYLGDTPTLQEKTQNRPTENFIAISPFFMLYGTTNFCKTT